VQQKHNLVEISQIIAEITAFYRIWRWSSLDAEKKS
jgi:hypothetical protein